jgi:hypothetical protein
LRRIDDIAWRAYSPANRSTTCDIAVAIPCDGSRHENLAYLERTATELLGSTIVVELIGGRKIPGQFSGIGQVIRTRSVHRIRVVAWPNRSRPLVVIKKEQLILGVRQWYGPTDIAAKLVKA